MDLLSLENNIKPLLQDFEIFINFIETEKPILSPKMMVLGKNDSFKLLSV